ncbi:MAG: hypothetical protein KF853_15875 [Rhodocyclaceae bacterium]|nr:hypothetical protein [Rhodocyclaceae bacterium]
MTELKLAVLGLSLIGTMFVWWRLQTWQEHRALKIVLAVVALFPVIGPFLCIWILATPDRAHPRLRATMNHFGIGGRFIGFGSKAFGHDDVSGEGDDWNPSVPERKRNQEKKRGR